MSEHPTQIGSYPVEREIGRGGMGIVYLGRDRRLERPVAIKVLPEAFALDPDRLARFEREARLLASLNHPNIAGIYGLEESNGQRFLALEYVEGETLAERLARGALNVDDAVDVCRQIATALEVAHENGVIHRDLKPGNVKLTPSGEVKVLDFGLAKGSGSSSIVSDPNMSQSPTLALTAATGAGVILGTAAYMSPEQARGKPTDRRTDIWSFGTVLFECLTGRQAFAGETVSDMIALILQGEPDWKALPESLSPRVRDLLERCLEKDSKKRLRDIGEARLVLEGDLAAPLRAASGASPTVAPKSSTRAWLGYALAAVFAIATAALASMLASRGGDEPVTRLVMPDPPGVQRYGEPAHMSFSPDGTMLAFLCGDSSGTTSLWLRSLGATEARMLPGTEDAALPFWSPDSRYVGFSTQERLKKVDVRGGNPEVLCALKSYGRGASWGSHGEIVFSGGGEGPLYKVSENGGEAQPLTELDSTETGHRFPHFLPDGKHFLYASLPPRAGLFDIYVGSLDEPKRERIMSASGVPRYVEPGYLMYIRNGRLVAHRFKTGSRKLDGDPITLADEPSATDWLGFGAILASQRGAVAYVRRPEVNGQLVVFDVATQRRSDVPVPADRYEAAVSAPDGKRAVVVKRTSATESDLWIVDLDRGSMSRFTFGPGRVEGPIWSPDGARIAFTSNRAGTWDIYEKAVGGAQDPEPLLTGGSILKYAQCWSRDGRTIMFTQLDEQTGWDILALPMEGDRTPKPYIRNSFDQTSAQISPDGRWVAYVSNESGRNEVYVQSFPTPSHKHQVSTNGGDFPLWRNDGRQLAYAAAGSGMLVDVQAGPEFRSGAATSLRLVDEISYARLMDDFARVLAIVPTEARSGAGALTVVLNWRQELEQR